jgi:beta-galactosidase
MNKSVTIIILIAISISGVFAQSAKVSLNDGWWFYKAELGSPWEAFRPEKQSKLPAFEKVTLPHCYNAYDAVDPDMPYYEGPAWYYKWFKVESPYSNGRIVLHFEGAGQKSEVYLFTNKAGSHTGGYDEWSVDITEAVKNYLKQYPEGTGKVPAGMIPIAVRTDNSRNVNLIPSDLSDFTLYGGLYRNVWLEYYPDVYMQQVHVDYFLDKKLKNATVTLTGVLNNLGNKDESLNIQVDVFNMEQNKVASIKNELISWNGEKEIATFDLKKINLWNPESPYLYTVVVNIMMNEEKQTISFRTGFKQFEFIEKGPFILNGERLLLKGTSRHEDYAGKGAAGSREEMRREMIMMKEMGINFIRLGHYQQPGYILDLCDSLGILVWEEIPWCRGGLGNSAYRQQARDMLVNLINQHYNHASVIIWGLGNENDWPGDFPEFEKDSIIAFMSELNDLAHSMDNVRKTAIRRCDFCKHIVDVYSPSIWAGWYRGTYTSYKDVSYMEAMQVDHFLHAEWGASMQPGRHSEDPDKGLAQISNTKEADERSGDFLLTGGDARVSKDGDWSETYGCNLMDWTLKEQETMEWLTGSAFWVFKDFSTPLRPDNPIPYVNEKGVVQRDLTPKEAYYVFQSYWTEKPMAHIYGHTWETRWGKKNENKLLKVYSNCNEAELFLNGASLGKRKRNSQDFPAAGLRWKTTFKEGKNTVKVIARKGKQTVTDSIIFNYQTQVWGKPAKLILEKSLKENNTTLICVKVIDKSGVFCPDAKNIVRFGITGNGKLINDLGTLYGSRKIQLSNGKACIKVKLKGKAVVSVISEGLPTTFLKLSW